MRRVGILKWHIRSWSGKVDALLQSLRDNARSKYWFWIEEDIDLCKSCTASIVAIQKAVCRHFEITLHELKANTRAPNEVLARQIGMYLSLQFTDHSHNFIAQKFNRAGHKCSIWSRDKIKKLLGEGHPIAQDIEEIKARLLVASASGITYGADHDVLRR